MVWNLAVAALCLEKLYFQTDFNNCFGAVENGGTDIRGKKCTWLIVQALNKASTEQRAVLEVMQNQTEVGAYIYMFSLRLTMADQMKDVWRRLRQCTSH